MLLLEKRPARGHLPRDVVRNSLRQPAHRVQKDTNMSLPYYPNSLIAAILAPNPLVSSPPTLLGEVTKRKTFFSFHYDDAFRVNNVRNAWLIDHPNSALMRSFYDSSLWESKKAEGDEAVKKLIREGVDYTSAVCVLVGTQTWSRPWVRYEIARAIIDGRGLLGVHLNGINHHQRRTPDALGPNPLDFMAVGPGNDGKQYLFEKTWIVSNPLTGQGVFQWRRYADYTNPVLLPPWLPAASQGYVRPLSEGAAIYNYVTDKGHENIGSWIDVAARRVGR